MGYGVGMGAGLLCWHVPIAGCWSGMLADYPIWLAGALMAEILAVRQRRSLCSGWACSLCVALSLGALATIHLFPESSVLALLMNMVMGATAIGAFAELSFDLLKTRLGRALEWLGIRSYSLYIFHFPVQVLIAAWCIQTYGERPHHGWLATLGTLLSLGAGLLAFHQVERHFLPQRLQAA